MGSGDHGDDPKTYDEAMLDFDSKKWLKAMKSDIDSMHSNQVWTLVDPLEGIYLLGVNRFTRERLVWMIRQRLLRQG